jgi:hypothetical protein
VTIITLELAPFPALLTFLKCILEVVFFEGVQHRLRLRLDHVSYVKMAASSFRVTENSHGAMSSEWVGWGTAAMLLLVKEIPGRKGSVKWRVVVLQQPVMLSPKFSAKSSHIFMKSSQNVAVLYGTGCVAYDDTCGIATANTFVAKVRAEVFAYSMTAPQERRSTIRN